MKVTGLNVSIVDGELSEISEDFWMSSDVDDATAEVGYQADGIKLPKKAIDS